MLQRSAVESKNCCREQEKLFPISFVRTLHTAIITYRYNIVLYVDKKSYKHVVGHWDDEFVWAIGRQQTARCGIIYSVTIILLIS